MEYYEDYVERNDNLYLSNIWKLFQFILFITYICISTYVIFYMYPFIGIIFICCLLIIRYI